MSIYILYVLIGFFAGIISGLLGIGGGIIVVPALAFIFLQQGIVPPDLVMHMAIGSSLTIMVATTFATVRAYHQFGWVLWPLYKRMIPGIVIGSIFGVILADLIQSESLFIIFGLFLIAVSCMMLFLRKSSANISLPRPILLNLTTTAIGTQASLLGVGGGILTTPFLVKCNVPIRNATALSALCGFTIAMVGSATNLITGWNELDLPTWSSGYIYWPAVGIIAIISMLSVPIGAKLAYHLPTNILRRFFALFIFLTGVRMLWS